MRFLASSTKPGVRPDQDGFGILEGLITLAIVFFVGNALNQHFLAARNINLYTEGRLQFEEDFLRLLQVTEEDAICERLSFVNAGVKTIGEGAVLATMSELKLDFSPLITVGRKKRYSIDKIELIQDTVPFGLNPTRMRATLRLTASFFDEKGEIMPQVGSSHRVKSALMIITTDATNTINSCYGRFSRRLACQDTGGTYNREVYPNCQL